MPIRFYKIICLLTLLLSSCGKQASPAITPKTGGGKVTIGVIAPLSGISETQGRHGLKGIKTAMHLQPALFNCDAVELLVEDDGDNPEMTVKAFRKLVEQDHVSGILVLSSSQAVLKINEIADRLKTPVLALIASHPDIAKNTKYLNQLCFDNEFQGKVASLFARDELLVRRAAVFVDNTNPHSKSLAEIFTKKFIETGGEVIVTFPIDSEMEHLDDTIKYMKGKEIELLYMPINAQDFIQVSKALQKVGWNPVRMGSDGLLSDVFARHHKDLQLLEGMVGIDFYAANVPMTDNGKLFLNAYTKLFNSQGLTYTVAGLEGYAIMFNAINRCNDYSNQDEINEKLRETVDFEGFICKITIDKNGKAQRPLFVNTIQDGKLKFLVKVY